MTGLVVEGLVIEGKAGCERSGVEEEDDDDGEEEEEEEEDGGRGC